MKQPCTHTQTSKETIDSKNESGHEFSFERTTCANCGRWISDKNVKHK